jgi:hypothetical protein
MMMANMAKVVNNSQTAARFYTIIEIIIQKEIFKWISGNAFVHDYSMLLNVCPSMVCIHPVE